MATNQALSTRKDLGTMGACLAQLDDNGIERPVAYASANLSDAQQNYGITDKEGLAVVWAVRKWRHFIHGSSAVGDGVKTPVLSRCPPPIWATRSQPAGCLASGNQEPPAGCRLSPFVVQASNLGCVAVACRPG